MPSQTNPDESLQAVPGHKGGFNALGVEGVVVRVYTDDDLSPNRDIKVEFAEPKRWLAHFVPEELELVE